MRYQAIRNSYGFMGQYWNEGEITPDLPNGHKPPEHFAPLAENKSFGASEVQSSPEEPETAEEIQAEEQTQQESVETQVEPETAPAPKARGSRKQNKGSKP